MQKRTHTHPDPDPHTVSVHVQIYCPSHMYKAVSGQISDTLPHSFFSFALYRLLPNSCIQHPPPQPEFPSPSGYRDREGRGCRSGMHLVCRGVEERRVKWIWTGKGRREGWMREGGKEGKRGGWRKRRRGSREGWMAGGGGGETRETGR